MNRDTLYKLLAEHYELDPKTDWYQLHGKWIMTHDAVRKVSNQPTPDGHRVKCGTPPTIHKDGSTTGIIGNEVVLGNMFHLIDGQGQSIHNAYAIGEANTDNTKLPYPWAMAYKRMFDRGVLDVLGFAEMGMYSDVEADVFKQPVSERVAPEPPKNTVGRKPVPLPPSPRVPEYPKSGGGGGEQQEAKVEEVFEKSYTYEEFVDAIQEALMSQSGGMGRSGLMSKLSVNRGRFSRYIKTAVEEGLVIRTGEKRGTRYFYGATHQVPVTPENVTVEVVTTSPPQPAPPSPAAPSPPVPTPPKVVEIRPTAPQNGGFSEEVTKSDLDERTSAWLNAGCTYLDIGRALYQVTGAESGQQAIEDGLLTSPVMDKIETLMKEAASSNE